MIGMHHSTMLAALAFVAIAATAGCVTVKPYEREVLARNDMQLDPNPNVSAAEAHTTDIREGSQGGFGVGGGGCGCN